MAQATPTLHLELSMPVLQKPYDEKPKEVIENALVGRVSHRIGKLLLEPGFQTDSAINDISSTVREEIAFSFLEVVEEEKERRGFYPDRSNSMRSDPLLTHIETVFGEGIEPEKINLSFPDEFPEEFIEALRGERQTLEYLEMITRHPIMREHVLPLLKRLSVFDNDGWHLVGGGAAKAYDIIKPLIGDKRFTVPHTEAELLYILVHIPGSLRHMVQDLLIHQLHMSFVEEQRELTLQKGEPTEMHEGLLELLHYGILRNSHWQRLANFEGSSEEMNSDLADNQMKFLETKQKLADITIADPSQTQILRTFMEHSRNLHERMQEIDQHFVHNDLQLIDIGHCFKCEIFYSFHDIWDGEEIEENKKSGSMAAILEDNPAQMVAWQTLVEKFTEFSLPENNGNTFSTPSDELLDLAEDPNVRLFLIDIENGDDRTAGIRVADEIVKRLLAQCGEKQEWTKDRDSQRTIVLWSMSPELVKHAQKHFAPLLSPEKYEDRLDRAGNQSIRLQIQLKSGFLEFTQ